MKTEAAPFRLEDYRAPAFTIDTVELDFQLDPSATRVTARLAIRPNTDEARSGRLELAGDEITLKGLKLDGAPLAQGRYTATPSLLTLHDAPNGPFTLEIETEVDPAANTKLMGLYRTTGTYCTQCEAEGFRRITYFLDRRGWRRRKPTRRSCSPTAIRSRAATSPARTVTTRSGTTPSPSRPTCSRWSPATSA